MKKVSKTPAPPIRRSTTPYAKLVMPRDKHPVGRRLRALRASWRDTSALFREFRTPILLFIVVTVGGGYIYGELHVMAGHERIPFIDLPYIMTALMILESPIDVPSEPYLILFWYLLPPIAVYIFGRGAADFVRLFFNRNERRDAWEEAVASTYRNHIIVLGIGHVGQGVAETLTEMGFEVIAVDHKTTPELSERFSELGIPLIVGDGRTSNTLEKAGLAHAEAFVACTSNDFVNLEAIMRARDMNPSIRIVARMWDDQFANQLKNFMGVSAVISSSRLAAPIFAGSAVGIEITQTLTVHGKEYSMIRLTVARGSFMDGQSIDYLQTSQNMDIVLHGTNGDVDVHPRGDVVVQAGDTLVIFADHGKILEIVTRNRPSRIEAKGIG